VTGAVLIGAAVAAVIGTAWFAARARAAVERTNRAQARLRRMIEEEERERRLHP